MDKTRRLLEARLAASGSTILAEERVDHREDAVAEAMAKLADLGADFLILFGASAVVDRKDILPAAIERAGGTVEQFGMPVDPGNLLMTGTYGGLPVIGAPGCARSPKGKTALTGCSTASLPDLMSVPMTLRAWASAGF